MYTEDINIFSNCYVNLPTVWDGRKSILEMKDSGHRWKDVEWIGFYFEFKSFQLLADKCEIPGHSYGNVTFDLRRTINWDLKASAVKSDKHQIILNDKLAMEESISTHGVHGEIIAICDVDYNDDKRAFQQWHTELKGGLSNYERDRIERDATSRVRKTHAVVSEILFLIIKEQNLGNLEVHKQGRNSDGSPREPKYKFRLEQLENFEHQSLKFQREQ